MKGRVAVLGQIGDQRAAALMVDGRLDDFLIEPAADLPLPGAIYRAVVDRQIKGQGGVFVRLPGGTGFLRQAKGLAPGQEVLVQVTGFAEDGKAVPVTQKLLFKSRYAIVTPDAPGLNISRSIRDDDRRDELLGVAHEVMAGASYGAILRSSAAAADLAEIGEDLSEMNDLARQVLGDQGQGGELLLDGPDPHQLAWREWDVSDVETDPRAFEILGVYEAVEALRQSSVRLPGGGTLHVEPTRALVAVDVNTGADSSPAAALKANLATTRELPRQLRLRGLGGQVTIDFAPLAKKDRRQVEQQLRAAFRADAVDTNLVGWTPLGHFELARKRERLPLVENLPT